MNNESNLYAGDSRAIRLTHLLAGRSDPFNLPEPDEFAELLVRVAALESQLQHTQTALSARVDKLGRALAATQNELAAAQRELAAARQERAALAPKLALADLTPAVAHDLNSSLNSVGLVSETLARELAAFRQQLAGDSLRRGDLNAFLDRLDTGTRVLDSAGGRARELAGSLKTLAIDSDSGRRRRFALDALLGDVLTGLQPLLQRQQVRLAIDMPAALALDSYPGALAQVLLNLVQNALIHAFAQPGGKLAIAAAALPGERVRLSISDDGVGMPAAVMTQLFTPYFTTRGDSGGTGLGLSSTRDNVEKILGGTIDVDSTPGAGTCFTLTLPLVAPQAD